MLLTCLAAHCSLVNLEAYDSALGGSLALVRLSREMLLLMSACLGPEETSRTSGRLDKLHETDEFKILLNRAL